MPQAVAWVYVAWLGSATCVHTIHHKRNKPGGAASPRGMSRHMEQTESSPHSGALPASEDLVPIS